MGSRERKRTERTKRKRRSAERVPATEEEQAGSGQEESFQAKMGRRSEQRNAEARAALKPLAQGERPTAVTIGAIVSAVIAIIFTVSAVVAAIGSVEVQGNEPSPLPLAIFAVPLWLMTWGMWKSRYWAVLGFQMLLVLFLLSGAVGLLGAASVLQVLATLLLLLGSGALFYFMIRAMARIQMPSRPGAE